MAQREVFRFLRDLSHAPEQVALLRGLPKPDVLSQARQSGYAFSEPEFDEAIWGLEGYVAKKLGETFDFSFSLWETMWGRYYLEFLVDNLVGALAPEDLETFLRKPFP